MFVVLDAAVLLDDHYKADSAEAEIAAAYVAVAVVDVTVTVGA